MVHSQNPASEAEQYLAFGSSRENPTQSRLVGDFLISSDFNTIEEIDPFTQMGHNPATSEKQARFMRACAHGAKMRKKCPSKSVARKYMHTG